MKSTLEAQVSLQYFKSSRMCLEHCDKKRILLHYVLLFYMGISNKLICTKLFLLLFFFFQFRVWHMVRVDAKFASVTTQHSRTVKL